MNWSSFQTALVIILGLIVFIAVLIFAGIIPGFRAPSGGAGGSVTLWGTIPEESVRALLAGFSRLHEKEFTLNYVAKNPLTIESELVEALASGEGPDLVMLPHQALWRERNKLWPFSFETVSERAFLDSFVSGANLYLDPQNGSWALPLLVDPLVLYYNADLLATGHFATPPASWDDLQTMAKALSKSDARANLSRSAIALGEVGNIPNAKDILSLLMLQTGNPVAVVNQTTGKLDFTLNPEAVDFYTRFADPTNSAYSWNSAKREKIHRFGI